MIFKVTFKMVLIALISVYSVATEGLFQALILFKQNWHIYL
jgi:hypothetical protein